MTRRDRSRVGLCLLLVLILSVYFSGCGITASAVAAEGNGTAEETAAAADVSERKLRDGLETILVLGLDKYEPPKDVKGYVNHTQSDFLLLVVLDHNQQKIQTLHINRDTMTEITRLGVFGGTSGKYTAQIALAHSYGSGGSDSALNSVKAVSKMLDGVKIDHYMTLTMDAVPIVNDMVGGVTVTVEDDFSEYDPSLVKGETITLMGEQSLHFVRGRHGVADGTNLNRMNRQRQYMTGLFEKVMEAASKDEAFFQNLMKKLGDTFDTDMSLYQLNALPERIKGYTMEPFRTIEGENIRGEFFMEFYLDEASKQEQLQALFYE